MANPSNPFADIPKTKSAAPPVEPIPGGPEYKEAIQGLTFGFGEEAMAKGRELLGGPPYEAGVKAEREQLKQFEKEKPVEAAALQIGGGIAPALITGGLSSVEALKPAAKAMEVGGNLTLSAMKKYYPQAFSKLPEFIKTAVTGAEAGAKYGAGAAEKPSDIPVEMATGAVGGGAVGGALGIGKAALTPVFRNLFGDVNEDAARRIMNALEADKTTPEELANRLRKLGPEKRKDATLADVGGENLRALMRVGTNAPGETRESATRFLTERQRDQYDRINSDVEKLMIQGKGEDVYTLKKELDKVRKAMANPLYEKAESVPVIMTPELKKIINKFPKDVIALGKQQFQEEGLPIPAIPKNVKGPVDFRFFDLLKRGLDRSIENEQDKVTKQYSSLGATRLQNKTEFLNYLDTVNPYYKAARNAWSGESASMKLLDEGKQIFKSNPAAVQDRFNKLDAGQQQYFRLGAAEAIKDAMAGKKDELNKAAALFGAPKTRDRLRSVFPSQEAFDKFAQRMDIENKMFKTGTFLSPTAGSKTASALTDIGEFGTEKEANVLKDLLDLNLGSLAMRLSPSLYGTVTGVKPETAAALQRSLLTPGAKVSDLAEQMARARAKQAAAAAKTGQAAKVLPAPVLLQNRREQYPQP